MNEENNFIKYKPFIESKIANISFRDIDVDDYELNTSVDSKHVKISIITNKFLDEFQKIFRKERSDFNKALEKNDEKDESKYADEEDDEKNSTLAKNFKQKIKEKLTKLFQYEIILNDIQQKKHRTKINYSNLILCEVLEALNNAKENRSVGTGQEKLICTTKDLYSIDTKEITKIQSQYNLRLHELEILEKIEKNKQLIIKAGSKLNISLKKLSSLEKKLSDKEDTLDSQIKRSKDTVTDANSKLKDSRDKDKTNQKIAKVEKKSESDIKKYKDQYKVFKEELTPDIKSRKVKIKALEKIYQIDKKVYEDEIISFKEQIAILYDTNHKKLNIVKDKIKQHKIHLEEEQAKLRQLNSEDLYDKVVITSIERSINKIEQQIEILEGSVPDNNNARFLKKLNTMKLWSTTPFYNKSPKIFQHSYQKALLAFTFDPIKQNKDIIWKAIRYLQSYNLITMTADTGAVHNSYYLNLEHWFKSQKHSFKDKDFIKNILPLLAAFLKYTAPNKVNDFLNYLDEIVDFLYKDPKNFSSSNNKESIVLEALKQKKCLDIEVLEGDKDTFFKSITPLQLFFDDNYNKVLSWKYKRTYQEKIYYIDKISIQSGSKETYIQGKNIELLKAINTKTKMNIQIENIIYKDVIVVFVKETDKGTYEIFNIINPVSLKENEKNYLKNITLQWVVEDHKYLLDEIYSIKLAKTKTSTSKKPTVTDKKGASFIRHQEEYHIPDRKSHSVILEVDMNLSSFFDTGALKNQKMYKTELEKKAFCTENKIPYEENNRKVYVSAYDKTEDVIHIAKRCLPGVQILKPDDAKEKFNDIIKSLCEKLK